jgi:hypothetical protein
MNNPALNDTVTNGFANDIFCVFFGVQVQLDADITKGDAGV